MSKEKYPLNQFVKWFYEFKEELDNVGYIVDDVKYIFEFYGRRSYRYDKNLSKLLELCHSIKDWFDSQKYDYQLEMFASSDILESNYKFLERYPDEKFIFEGKTFRSMPPKIFITKREIILTKIGEPITPQYFAYYRSSDKRPTDILYQTKFDGKELYSLNLWFYFT